MTKTTTLLTLVGVAGIGLYFVNRRKRYLPTPISKTLKNLFQFQTSADMEGFWTVQKLAIETRTLQVPWVYLVEVPDELVKKFARENPDTLFTSLSRDVWNGFSLGVEFPKAENEWGVGAVPITGPGAYDGEGEPFPLPVNEGFIDVFVIYAKTGVVPQLPEGATMGGEGLSFP